MPQKERGATKCPAAKIPLHHRRCFSTDPEMQHPEAPDFGWINLLSPGMLVNDS
jgi:hypothetical protein